MRLDGLILLFLLDSAASLVVQSAKTCILLIVQGSVYNIDETGMVADPPSHPPRCRGLEIRRRSAAPQASSRAKTKRAAVPLGADTLCEHGQAFSY